jgi:hypothetical protein
MSIPYAKSDEWSNTALAVNRAGRAGRNDEKRGTKLHLKEWVICMTGMNERTNGDAEVQRGTKNYCVASEIMPVIRDNNKSLSPPWMVCRSAAFTS